MMTIRIYGLLLAFALQGLGFTTSSLHAAGVKQQTTVVKQQKSKRKTKKITHPCARKSAVQLNKRAKPFLNSMTIHSIRYEVDRDLIQSVITVESCYKLKAKSPKQAQGLMQLIPATAERFGIRNPYNAYQNIKGGTKYLAWLSKRFDGDLSKVLAAYNAGEGRVDRYNGIPPFRETRNYVHDVLAVYNKLKAHSKQQIQVRTPQASTKKQPQTVRSVPRPVAKKPVVAAPAKRVKPAVVVRPAINLTPQQRQLQAKRQQLRQIQLRKQQQRQAQLRQQHLLKQRRQQQARQANSVMITGAPSRPIMAQQQQITIGKPPVKAVANNQRAQAQAQAQRAKQQAQRQAQAAKRAPAAQRQVNKTQTGRVRGVYRTNMNKPGRGGWQATKALAPQLFKQ